MTCRKSILVVANITAMSDELLDAIQARADLGPTAFTLIVPAAPHYGGRAAAATRLDAALDRLRGAGLEVEGRVAAGDPVEAVSEAWDPRRYDEIIISTLPMRVSKWLHRGLPQRIAELTDALVTHVVSHPPRPPVKVVHEASREESMRGPLAPLRAWEAILREPASGSAGTGRRVRQPSGGEDRGSDGHRPSVDLSWRGSRQGHSRPTTHGPARR